MDGTDVNYADQLGIDLLVNGVGAQTDGTYAYPTAAQPVNQIVDVGGGSAANYSQGVLDLLNKGIGAWSATVNNSQMLDYKRYEATQGGVFQQGQQAGVVVASGGFKVSPMMIIILIGAYVLLKKA
ncbi:MAG: hypothetical protein ACXWJD_04020 [Burkholderiaceae bacterium]